MFGLPRLALDMRAVTYFGMTLLVLAGLASYTSLGQLEDPDFTVKTAVVTTLYPGASPTEVELEVTDKIELKIQEMPEIDFLESYSSAGASSIKVNIKPSYSSSDLPQIWDQLRRKIRDIEGSLPPGAQRPIVSDDFGDVYGLVLGLTGDGFSYAELEQYAKELKKNLSLVDGVARIELWGVQPRVVYLDVQESQLVQLGISEESLQATLQHQNVVVDAGRVDVTDRRLRIAPSGASTTPEEIESLILRPSAIDAAQSGESFRTASDQLLRVGDVGSVRMGYRDPPVKQMRLGGLPSIAIAIANQSGTNVVTLGRELDSKIKALVSELPIGLEIQKVHWQSDVIDEAVSGFFISLLEAVLIVLVVLTLAMGWRMGVIIGSGLVLTILATFILMALFGIDLQRMSLGALVIALGMMVDNSIVVADGVAVRLAKGEDPTKAAIASASQPSWPLLGATIIAVLAFYPIAASQENAGEYCASLFSVVAISLMASWFISMTVTPVQCVQLLRPPKDQGEDADGAPKGFFGAFQRFLEGAIRLRVATIATAVGLLVVSFAGFGSVTQLFFPDSSMTKFMIDYWAPEGTTLDKVSRDLSTLEKQLATDERVLDVASFIGAGPPRFYLPVEPQSPNSSYGQIIVNVRDFREIPEMMRDLKPFLTDAFVDAVITLRPFGVGPSDTWKFEARISGPALADPDLLRKFGAEGMKILQANPQTAAVQTDWRQRVPVVVPAYDTVRARFAGITRDDVARTTKKAYDGRAIGILRDGEDLLPIVLRYTEEERRAIQNLDLLQIRPTLSTKAVPLSQVVDGVEIQWDDPIIGRRDRKRTITIQSNPVLGVTLPSYRASVVAEFEELAARLPSGYTFEWGGEFENSQKSQASLLPGVVPAVAIVLFLLVVLFNALRPMIMIMSLIPFVIIGITWGLLFTGTPFGFVALLGAMSLAGMMIKNSVVLLDEVNLNLELGQAPYDAVVGASVARLRPVALAAGTTVLGVIPLLQDVFWIGLAITVMAGLTIGTVLTMVLLPVLYCVFYGIRKNRTDVSPPEAEVQPA